jgi:hypothetical protein
VLPRHPRAENETALPASLITSRRDTARLGAIAILLCLGERANDYLATDRQWKEATTPITTDTIEDD